jgi:hypothetical protein
VVLDVFLKIEPHLYVGLVAIAWLRYEGQSWCEKELRKTPFHLQSLEFFGYSVFASLP